MINYRTMVDAPTGDLSWGWRIGFLRGFILWRQANLAGRATPLVVRTRRSGLRPPVFAGKAPGGAGQLSSQQRIYSQCESARR
jgi:hypothetical protein